ncbi:MAG: glycosyltransferase, partial [Prevotellaceae bacterium]|nr:glycosyltransferase [Prevotellaceae bacterium]
MTDKEMLDFYRGTAEKREWWNKRNSFYHTMLERYFSFIIPKGKRVIEIGCGSGNLLNAVRPAYGLGIDFAPEVVEIARAKYPHLRFEVDDIENLQIDETFDYVIISDLMGSLWDAQKAIHNVRRLCLQQTRVVISQYNFLWEPVIKLLEFLHLKQKLPLSNWFSIKDTESLLQLEEFQTVQMEKKILLPCYIPVLHSLFNGFLVNLPVITHLGLVNLHVSRPVWNEKRQLSVSIVIPARNERGNIENAIRRTPDFGTHQEFIFIEGNSSDNTYEEILRVQAAYPDKDIKVMKQTGKGKGNAVREAFDVATGDVLMILDADLTVSPEELPKFYDALCRNKGEFINGCRLVYPMDKNAMRFLNLLGNKFFGWFFSYLLSQPLKDTLCGTKVLFRKD